MKKNNISFILIIYLVSFVIVWLCFIFWLDKNEFDLEFREKETTTAIIFNLETDEIVEELYEGRQTNVHKVKYIEYFYLVDGIKYEYGSESFGNEYSVADEIQIEYLKSNPSISKVKGLINYSYNYFIRNLILVVIFSLFLMIGIISIIDSFRKSN